MWALGEIVKAQAGILEARSPSDVAREDPQAVEDALTDSADAAWIEPQLLALVGLGAESELGGDRRGQAFAAWRRFLEALAEQRPLVLVVEDLHWADDSMLDFVDELVDWVTGRPAARRRDGPAGAAHAAAGLGRRQAQRDDVALVSRSRTSRRPGSSAALLARPVLPRRPADPARDTPAATRSTRSSSPSSTSSAAPPRTSAPRDIAGRHRRPPRRARPPTRRTSSQDARSSERSSGAVRSRRDAEVDRRDTLHSLERKGFVRASGAVDREPRVEYAFAHALVRDVAYGQLPRAERAAKHRAVAEWIESLGRNGGPRGDARLPLAVGARARPSALARRSRSSRSEPGSRAHAGDRASSLNAFARGEPLRAGPRHSGRATIARYPSSCSEARRSALQRGRRRDEQALEDARDALARDGRSRAPRPRPRRCSHELPGSGATATRGRSTTSSAPRRSSNERAPSLGVGSRSRLVCSLPDAHGRHRWRRSACEPWKRSRWRRASISTDLRIHALTTIGRRKENLGDIGADDASSSARSRSLGGRLAAVAGALNNLAVVARHRSTCVRVDELSGRQPRSAERFGDANIARFLAEISPGACILGEWDEALSAPTRSSPSARRRSPHPRGPDPPVPRLHEARAGRAQRRSRRLRTALELARAMRIDPEIMVPAL